MTGQCIHCHQRPRERGLYCSLCWLVAKAHAAEAAGKEHARTSVPGVQRAKFDACTCPCHRPEMHYRREGT